MPKGISSPGSGKSLPSSRSNRLKPRGRNFAVASTARFNTTVSVTSAEARFFPRLITRAAAQVLTTLNAR